MPIRIFDNDNEAKPKGQFSDDIVGRFRSGMQANGLPVALSEWRITTGDPDVADALAALLGGTPEEWEATGEDGIEVLTSSTEVPIILDGPGALRSSMVIWGNNGLVHECDGEFMFDEDRNLTDEACPFAGLSVKDHKEASKRRRNPACGPSIQVYFRLADSPEMGKFKFFSGSWGLAETVGTVEAKLAKIGGPALAKLTLEKVEYTNKQGKAVSFTKPVVTVTGPAPEVAEEPF